MVHQEKMLEIFREHHRWQEIVGLGTVGDFNKACQEGRTTELINVAEALQEKKIVRIADEIQSRRNLKLILIAGPSSSGKTTFSKRLSIQLMANGIKPYPISLDDYFWIGSTRHGTSMENMISSRSMLWIFRFQQSTAGFVGRRGGGTASF